MRVPCVYRRGSGTPAVNRGASLGYGGDIADAHDLTRMAGIGSKVAEGLNEAGIWAYAELTSRFAQDIMALPDISGLPLA